MTDIPNLLRWSLKIAFIAVLLHLGLFLLPFWTMSPRLGSDAIYQGHSCQPVGDDWHCESAISRTVFQRDAGALVYAEIPGSFYESRFKLTELPKWNPYIGSGYPQFLDGHSRITGWSRSIWWLFPVEKTGDWITFLRFLIWTTGVVFACRLLGISRGLCWGAALVAPVLPYMRSSVDHVMLDVHCFDPWLLVLVLLPGWKTHDWRKLAILTGFFGLVIGFQAFAEAQVVFTFSAGFIFIAMALNEKNLKYVYGLAAMAVGFAISFLPGALPYLRNLDQLISNRIPGSCFIANGLGWQQVLESSVRGWDKSPEWCLLFSIPGLFLLPFLWRTRARGLLLAYVPFVFASVYGFPRLFCLINGLNGVLVMRHLVPVTQALFLVLLIAGLAELLNLRWFSNKRPAAAHAWAVFLAVLVLFPTHRKGILNVDVLEGKAQKGFAWNWSVPGSLSVVSALHEKSEKEDRRHFSPGAVLAPNWSAPTGVLDLRVLYAFYPKAQHALYTTLVKGWITDSAIPDRFDRIASGAIRGEDAYFELGPASGLEKLLVIARVSLLSIKVGEVFPSFAGSVYRRELCRKIGEDVRAQSWLCPEIGGVGFFPAQTEAVPTEAELMRLLAEKDAVYWRDRAVVIGAHVEAATGEVLNVSRQGDRLEYRLRVRKPGLFVVADNMFPGWHAAIDGNEIPIRISNLAWKSVEVPKGEIALSFEFRP